MPTVALKSLELLNAQHISSIKPVQGNNWLNNQVNGHCNNCDSKQPLFYGFFMNHSNKFLIKSCEPCFFAKDMQGA